MKPDVEMIHDKTGKIYFGGKVYDVTYTGGGWTVTRPGQFNHIYVGDSVEDCCVWLQVQQNV